VKVLLTPGVPSIAASKPNVELAATQLQPLIWPTMLPAMKAPAGSVMSQSEKPLTRTDKPVFTFDE
jgi:hypothetical protein